MIPIGQIASTIMPALDNARQELFAQAVAQGTTLAEAYETAGYEPNRHNASRLKNTNENVQQRIREIQRYGADISQITVASLVERADELRELAIEHKQISAGVAAVKEIGILTGLRIDRREVGEPGEFARLSDDELLKLVEGSVEMVALPSET